MKRKRTIISTLAILMLATAGSVLPPLSRASGSSVQPDAALDPTAPAIESCPDLPIRITALEVTPKTPAQRHTVRIAWDANVPGCYTANQFTIRGVLTFANNQTKAITKTVAGTERSAQVEVPGLLAIPTPLAIPSSDPRAPRRVSVTVAGTAGADIAGSSSGSSTTCPLNVGIRLLEAEFAGLVASPGSPGSGLHPKVKVSWQTPALPECFSIRQFLVVVEISINGNVRRDSKTVAGNVTSTEVIFDAITVPQNFRPDRVTAIVTASGKAAIGGQGQKDALVTDS